MLSAHELVDKIRKYCPDFNHELVIKAYDLSKHAHRLQYRSSGDPYFLHPLSVAEILIDFEFDVTCVIVALLHDVIEDTDVSYSEIEKIFGEKIADLVNGVTKLTKIEHMTSKQRAAENFKKLVLATANDIRVLIVKLADRLHNMRTINFIKDEKKRIKISEESLNIYASLARRIGMYKVQDELQDLSFSQTNPKIRNYIINKLLELKQERSDLVQRIIATLTSKLLEGISGFKIYGREKTPYSIWQKMKKTHVGFDQLHDIIAFRVIVNNISECYKALGIINTNYNIIPGTFDDFISNPKDNDYQSIHLSILGPKNKRIEVQIRTQIMHNINEKGIASHWNYKENIKENKERQQYAWLRELVSLFEHSTNATDVFDEHGIHIYEDQVFCFTPEGDIFNLPMRSTALDFAYAIHSDIGNKCSGVKINGVLVSLRHKLSNGDQVEIMTDQNVNPSVNWLQFVITSKAKVAIKHFIKNKRNDEYSKLGKIIINKFFDAEGLSLNDGLLERNLKKFQKKNLDELYIAIAERVIPREDVVKALYSNYELDSTDLKKSTIKNSDTNKKHFIPIQGLVSGISVHFPKCCLPIPGDEIIGIINVGTGIAIHNILCANLRTTSLASDKVVNICWKNVNEIHNELFTAQILVTIKNICGGISSASSIISNQGINIADFKVINREINSFELLIDLKVLNLNQLEMIVALLRMSDKIIKVSRYQM